MKCSAYVQNIDVSVVIVIFNFKKLMSVYHMLPFLFSVLLKDKVAP